METIMAIVRRSILGLASATIAAATLSRPTLAQTGDLTVFIIRHGEKPKESWPGPGLTFEGSDDKKSLVVRGWQRAGSWAALFGSGLASADYPRPTTIFAADPITVSGEDSSHRSFETISPLAARLGLTPITTYGVGQEVELAADVNGRRGNVLIAWEHKAIVAAILPALAGSKPLQGAPRKWDGARYDVVLRLDRAGKDGLWSVRQYFPRLLSGDSDTPMA
jgi:hypothetical protein